MELKTVTIKNPNNLNFILGQSHFIKTVEDLHEALITTVPGIKFGIAFSEASGPCLIRTSGNDKKLITLAQENAQEIGAGHTFIIFMEAAYPINLLPTIKRIPEIVTLFCATANPVEVVLAETKQGRGVLGVIDGNSPKGVESDQDKKERQTFLRTIGYKL